MSSTWDRACELYAQLTGGRVDYGVAHSRERGHERYGRTYKPLFEGWSEERPVHFMAHSFGGAAARLFSQLCAEGSAQERAATPEEELSPLFKGGMLNRVLSVTALASPHNGTTAIVSIQKGQPLWPFVPIYSMMSFIGTLPMINGLYDMHLEQFGLSNPAGERGNILTQKKLRAFLRSRDHATADLSLDGAEDVNRAAPIRPELVYFSFPCAPNTREISHGRRMITLKEFKHPLFAFWGAQIGLGMGFARRQTRVEDRSGSSIRAQVEYDPQWLESDVVVPLASARYPFGQPWKLFDGEEEVVPGVWHVMPTKYGVDHGYYCGWDPNNKEFEVLVEFYKGHIKLLEEACGRKEAVAAA